MVHQWAYTIEVIRKILVSVGILVIVSASTVVTSVAYNGTLEPPQLVTNFVDLHTVKRITKFRSCAGHTTVPQDGREMKRNMKHYVTLSPEYHAENLVEVYAPYDGYIALLFGKEEMWIAPGKKALLTLLPINRWMFSVTHVKPRQGLQMGDTVKAGELIGYGTFSLSEPGNPNFDVVYGKMSIPPKKVDNWPSPFSDLDSVFNHMSPEVLSQYENRGITRENIIITKERRDNDPCVYSGKGPYFEYKHGSKEVDSVDLR